MEKADSDLVSVVVPIYNVRPYLDRCISSLVNKHTQTSRLFLLMMDPRITLARSAMSGVNVMEES